MADDPKEIAATLEWDFFGDEKRLRRLANADGLPPGTAELTVRRNASYSLIAEFSGRRPHNVDDAPEPDGPQAGTLLVGTTVEGEDQHFTQYRLTRAIVQGLDSSIDPQSSEALFRGKLHVGQVDASSGEAGNATRTVDWYLNGPREMGAFCRATGRTTHHTFRLERDVGDNPPCRLEADIRGSSDSRDHLLVDAGTFKFLVALVPKTFGPPWSQSLSIEFQTAWGGIPGSDTREAVGEIISFLLGRQLLHVGSTSYAREHWLHAEARSPWGTAVADLCSAWSKPPMRVHDLDHPQRVEFEPMAGPLVASYLQSRDALDLKNAIWNYWTARRLPVGPNIVAMASATESLKGAWFKSTKTKSQGVNMEKAQFDGLFLDELAAIGRKLDTHPRKANIFSRFQNCYRMGAAEELTEFFREIDLPLGAAEKKALRDRNAPAHGGTTDPAKALQLHSSYQAYEVLFHRVLLKTLGYSGTYVDYCYRSRPMRPMRSRRVMAIGDLA